MFEVVVIIPTYKRQEWLEGLLHSLSSQRLDIVRLRVLIADNDVQGSAETTFLKFNSMLNISYIKVKQKGLATVRNAGLSAALNFRPDFVSFLDDDEWVSSTWVETIVKVALESKADFVAGPVSAVLDYPYSSWITDGGYLSRKRYKTGTSLTEAGAGNLLISTNWLRANTSNWFDREFDLTGGEDSELTRRAYAQGSSIIWADEAEAWEHIPIERVQVRTVFKRQVRIAGVDFLLHARKKKSQYVLAVTAPVRALLGLIAILVGLAVSPKLAVRGLRMFARGWGFLLAFSGKVTKQYA